MYKYPVIFIHLKILFYYYFIGLNWEKFFYTQEYSSYTISIYSASNSVI